MAFKNDGPVQSYLAGAAINSFRFVKIGSADHTVIQAAAATDIGIGATEYGAASGAACAVQHFGIAKIKVGSGGVTRGTRVTSDSTGQAVAWATTNTVLGVALETAAAADVASVLLCAPAPAVA